VNRKLVCGVGINDADYVTKIQETIGYISGRQKQKIVWRCPFYQTWADMLKRGYSDKFKDSNPAYKDVTVCEEWHRFSVFKAWMENQDWESKELDKDLLISGNKVYSPDACVFVGKQINLFLVDSGASRGKYKIGVCWHKGAGKFVTRCSNPFTKKDNHLGLFTSEQEAHEAWIAKKLEYARDLAALQTDERIAKALIAKYTNYKGEM
jgi:hypothetical protein